MDHCNTEETHSSGESPAQSPELRSGCSQPHTYSPASLPLRCLRHKAMAVPMAAISTMAPMIPPMMVPVVGPFSGRRVPAEKQNEGQSSSGEGLNQANDGARWLRSVQVKPHTSTAARGKRWKVLSA